MEKDLASPFRKSSVSPSFDEFGELVFACDGPGPVIHRTPEELGIPRVVVDAPRTMSWTRPSSDTGPGSLGRNGQRQRARATIAGTMQQNRESAMRSVERINTVSKAASLAAKKMLEAELRVVGGEPVLMPPGATMGAEPLEGFIAERKKEKAMQGVKPRPDGPKCAVEGCDLLAAVGRAYCSKKHGWKSSYVPAAKRNALAAPKKMQPVEIEAERPGSAAALITALDKIDGREDRITLEFAVPEVVQILLELDDGKRRAFLSAGLRAALLS